MGNEPDVYVFSCLLGQLDGEIVDPRIVGEPAMGDNLVTCSCHIVYISLGGGYAHGDVPHVVLVHTLLQRREPQRAVLDGRLLVALAVQGDHALNIHLLLALLGIDDVDFQHILARRQVFQVDGRVGGVEVAGQDRFLAIDGGDLPGAVGIGLLLIGGDVLQRQLDGLVVEVDIVVLATHHNAAARAHDKRGGRLVGLAGIGGDDGIDAVEIAGPATPAWLEADVLLKQFGRILDGEVALIIGNDGGVLQVTAAKSGHTPPVPFVLGE